MTHGLDTESVIAFSLHMDVIRVVKATDCHFLTGVKCIENNTSYTLELIAQCTDSSADVLKPSLLLSIGIYP